MRIFCIVLFCSCLSSCYVLRAYNNRHLTLTSHKHLPFTTINKGDNSFHFFEGDNQEKFQTSKAKLDTELINTETAAFLIVRNDSIIYEKYFDGFDQTSLLPSFSVVKSFVGTLTGICFEEGKIKSLQEPMTDYLPEFIKKDERFKQITIQHLLDMRSGLKWNEGSYGLKDDAIKMAFRPNITPYVYKVKIKEPPGKQEYQSINTLLLAMIVERATGMHISEYLQQKLWQPLGMETNGTWTTDKHKREIAYAGLNATARDFAKFGDLYLHKGEWNGKHILSKEWINNTTGVDSMTKWEGYRNQFWGTETYQEFTDSASAMAAGPSINISNEKVSVFTTKEGVKKYYVEHAGASFYALGILGQYIYINPANNSVIVRLGHFWKHPQMSLDDFVSGISGGL
ncbi:MAG: serine hydrolase [Agriterribacter sp.]